MNRPAQPYRKLPDNLMPKDENASYVPSPEDFEDPGDTVDLPVSLYSIVDRRNLVSCRQCGLLVGEPVTHLLWHQRLEEQAIAGRPLPNSTSTRTLTFPTTWTGGDPGGLR